MPKNTISELGTVITPDVTISREKYVEVRGDLVRSSKSKGGLDPALAGEFPELAQKIAARAVCIEEKDSGEPLSEAVDQKKGFDQRAGELQVLSNDFMA